MSVHTAVQQLCYWIKRYEEIKKVELLPREFETALGELVFHWGKGSGKGVSCRLTL